MDFEQKIKGTPAKFAVMVELFDDRLLYRNKNSTTRYHVPGFAKDIPPDTNLVKIQFECKGTPGGGWITAQSLPDGNSLLIVWINDDHLSDLEPVWLLLFTELKRNDWLIQDQPATTLEDEEEYGPWSRVSDPDDQMIVLLLHKGQPSKEIARRIGNITAKTVDNKLSILRNRYGTEVVPYRK